MYLCIYRLLTYEILETQINCFFPIFSFRSKVIQRKPTWKSHLQSPASLDLIGHRHRNRDRPAYNNWYILLTLDSQPFYLINMMQIVKQNIE